MSINTNTTDTSRTATSLEGRAMSTDRRHHLDADDSAEDDDDEHYSTLITNGAHLVVDGHFSIDEIAVPTDDADEPRYDPDAFAADLEQKVADINERREKASGRTPTDRDSGPAPTNDATEVDWVRMWGEANLDPDTPLSMTQLALLVDISEQTPKTKDGAKAFVNAAHDAGLLVRHRFRYLPAAARGEPCR